MAARQPTQLKAPSTAQPRFIRRTQLGPNEYRVNFRQIDCEIIDALTSAEACKITPQMSRIYLRLLQAPVVNWEREGVLRFVGIEREGGWCTAWEEILELVGVASATAHKALAWMSETGIIGYFAGKNGVGIRIFINRAASSIRERLTSGQKNLRLAHTSSESSRTSSVEVPFKEDCSKKNSEVHIHPPTLTRSSGTTPTSNVSTSAAPTPTLALTAAPSPAQVLYLDKAFRQLRAEVSETVADICSREVARTRDWLEKAGLPKAVRVAQHETYQMLRSFGIVEKSDKAVGKTNASVGTSSPKFDLNEDETIQLWVDLAQSVRNQPLDEMLTEYVAGGRMSAEDARSILRKAKSLGLCEENGR